MSDCSICYESRVSPERFCKCSGDVGCVHRACLEKWLATSGLARCRFCRVEYRIERRFVLSRCLRRKSSTRRVLASFGATLFNILLIALLMLFVDMVLWDTAALVRDAMTPQRDGEPPPRPPARRQRHFLLIGYSGSGSDRPYLTLEPISFRRAVLSALLAANALYVFVHFIAQHEDSLLLPLLVLIGMLEWAISAVLALGVALVFLHDILVALRDDSRLVTLSPYREEEREDEVGKKETIGR